MALLKIYNQAQITNVNNWAHYQDKMAQNAQFTEAWKMKNPTYEKVMNDVYQERFDNYNVSAEVRNHPNKKADTVLDYVQRKVTNPYYVFEMKFGDANFTKVFKSLTHEPLANYIESLYDAVKHFINSFDNHNERLIMTNFMVYVDIHDVLVIDMQVIPLGITKVKQQHSESLFLALQQQYDLDDENVRGAVYRFLSEQEKTFMNLLNYVVHEKGLLSAYTLVGERYHTDYDYLISPNQIDTNTHERLFSDKLSELNEAHRKEMDAAFQKGYASCVQDQLAAQNAQTSNIDVEQFILSHQNAIYEALQAATLLGAEQVAKAKAPDDINGDTFVDSFQRITINLINSIKKEEILKHPKVTHESKVNTHHQPATDSQGDNPMPSDDDSDDLKN